ncbi:oxidoreductase [Mycolicibacterium sp. 018/SC-01/001]|uniref:PDR/VanB family oxidoreductase n=1 Tax=Mycolicibacterium sp. 018/SC-01/001 TaxID=2592069 RepID=UPI00117C3FD1|nr:PDR/VanB family oxidoreductase [Mycolicibacterium sp. 018/SC-01/001]TRW82476.1 oxidoreductase [Mycolicibacterium sp. 018/SC-01/001]
MPAHYRQTPPSASGRSRHDPVLALAGAGIAGLFSATAAVRRVRPPRHRAAAPLRLTVRDRRVVARDQDVVQFTLAAEGGRALPRWYPGAHLDVHLPSGRIRQYSLCGDPADAGEYHIAVRRIPDGGGGSVECHDALGVGAIIHSHGPRNAFPMAVPGHGSPTRRVRFIAGGIGVTPILPMLRAARGLGVEWSMVYTGRSRDSLPFVDEVEALGATVRTDDADGLPTAATLLGDCPAGTAVYACGPAPMLTALHTALADRADVEVHVERFAAPPVVDGTPFDATVASTGTTITVGADQTLLGALQRSGVAAPYSCQQGFCGTCRVRVLDGAVEHRDTLLTDAERAAHMMLTCVSRGRGPLTLDL